MNPADSDSIAWQRVLSCLAVCCSLTVGCDSPKPTASQSRTPPERSAPATAPRGDVIANSADVDASKSWITFEPDAGGFSIAMPTEPRHIQNLITIKRQPMTLEMFVSAAKGESGVLMLGYGDYPNLPGLGTKKTDEGLMQSIISSTAGKLGGREIETESLEMDRGHGMVCRMKLKKGFAELRTIIVDGRLYQISAATDETEITRDNVDQFLDSFKMLPVAKPSEWSAGELEEKWKSVVPGTYVRIRGSVNELLGNDTSIAGLGRFVGVSLVFQGSYPTAPFQFRNPSDINGLQLKQELLLQGRAYPRKGVGTIAFVDMIQRGESPENVPPPYTLMDEVLLSKLSLQANALDQVDGIGFVGYSRMVDVSDASILNDDGTLPAAVAKELVSNAWIYGVRFSKVPINQNLVNQIATFRSLQHLEFDGTAFERDHKPNLAETNLQPIATLPALVSFRLNEYAGVNDSHLESIAKIKCLRQLELRIDTRSEGSPTDTGIGLIAGLPSLTHLVVKSGPALPSLDVTDAGFKPLGGHRSLSVLEIKSNQISGECLKAFARCPSLRNLSVTGTGIKNQSLEAFALTGWDSLRHLFLTSKSLTDEGLVRMVSVLPAKLRQLGLEDSPLTALTLAAICDRALEDLSYVNVRKAELEAQDVLVLSKLKTLRTLTIPRSVTPEIVEKLKAELPDARVYSN